MISLLMEKIKKTAPIVVGLDPQLSFTPKGILEKVIAGLTDRNMFSQGTPSQFMEAITTAQAVDIHKYESFSNNMDEVSTIINNQRLSISSVDTNEEAASLVIYQNGYNLSSKVISILNQVYDKLINQTG